MKTKLLLKIFSVLFAFTCLSASATTDVWTFDKTPVSSSIELTSSNYSEYLPAGWYAPSADKKYLIRTMNGTQYYSSQTSLDFENNYQPFYAKKGTLVFNARGRFGNMNADFNLWKATKDGNSFTLGDALVNETLSLTSEDADFTYTIPEDGYYAFSIYSGAMIKSVTNTYEGASAVTYSVSGTVVDEAGAPVADVNVAVGSASAVTDAEGKYTISGLADGIYDLVASKSGYENATASVTVSGADVTVDPITLSAVKWYLGGYVQNSNYQHVAGVAMQLYLGEELVGETTSDSEGNYRIAIPAEEKTYTLKMQAEYYKDYTSAVSVRESYLNADKVRTFNPYIEAKLVSFNLTVKDTWNQPVNGADVTINGENLANVKVYESGNTGVYVLRNKRAGDLKDNEYTWTVTADGYDVATGTVVFNGNDVNRSVTLIPTGTTVISGTVTDAEGKAISGAHVSLTIGAAAVPAASIDTNAEGFYSFARNDLEGSATVEVETDYYGSETKEVTEIMPNANNVCDFTLTELVYTYTATVKNQAGDFLADATVVFDGAALTGENGVFSTSMTAKDAAGREIPVEITCEGYQTQTFSVMLNRDINETYTLRKAEVAMTEVLIEVQDDNQSGIEGATVRVFTEGFEAVAEDWEQGMYYAQIPTEANMGKTFTIEVKAKGYFTSTKTFEFDGNEVMEVIELVKDPSSVEGILDDIDGDTVIFTIDGLRVEVKEGATLPAGLYIVNGKKLVVR